MKRNVCFVLILAFAATMAFAGGGSQARSGVSAEKIPMRYYMPGEPNGEDEPMVNAAINEALARDGVNIDFQPNYIPWDMWVDKTNLMLSTGEEFELIHIMEGFVTTPTYASRRHLTPLSALIKKEAPKLTGLFEQVLWDAATVKGEIYAVPALWRDNSGDNEGNTDIRKDKFDQYNIPYPQNINETISALTTLQQRWSAEDGIQRYVYEHQLANPPYNIHRTYDTWPFFVSMEGIFQVRQNGEANMYWETPEFRKDVEFMNTLYTRGLIHPDILNVPTDTKNNAKGNGDILMSFMTTPISTYDLKNHGANGEVVLAYKMALEKPMLMITPLLNCNGVPITTKHPEAGLKFLDWMYSSKANQDLVLYGIQGRTWEAVGTDEMRWLRDSEGNPLYAFANWMIEYVPNHRFNVDEHLTLEERNNYKGNIYPDRTVISPVVGFAFDSTPVRVEYANVLAEYTASILPIKLGVLSYATSFQAAQAKMKAAGSDAVIAEYRKQLAEFIASKK
jgi:putative aldouronate transport system substrate-binding protein